MRGQSQRAFTLVELLVVMAIIGILISLLLPAVQSAREAARRIRCAHNLMQLSIAVQNYESAHEMYPPGVTDSQGPIMNVAQGHHFGWLTRILPYIEQRTTFRHLDFTVSVYDDKNAPVRNLRVPIPTVFADTRPSPLGIGRLWGVLGWRSRAGRGLRAGLAVGARATSAHHEQCGGGG